MQIRILGPLEVSEDGRVVELGAGRQRALLALLALHAREIVATDRLIEELWGGSPPPTAPKALQNLVSQLRRSLGAAAIETVPPGYRLALADGDLDARQFERLAARRASPARRRSPSRRGRRSARRSALARTRRSPTSPTRTSRRARSHGSTSSDSARSKIGSTQTWRQVERAELVPELEALVSAHPLRERLRGQLMLALYRSGRQAEALDAYREGRDGSARGARARAGSRASGARAGDPEPGSGARAASEAASAGAEEAATTAPRRRDSAPPCGRGCRRVRASGTRRRRHRSPSRTRS